MRENLTELVFILDRSGSMSGLESDTIGGFNSMIKKQQKEEGEAIVSTVLFDDLTDVIHDRVPIKDVKKLTEEDYFVRGCTALLDALGETIRQIVGIHRYARPEDVPEHTTFVIMTDGMENASHRFDSNTVKKMIAHEQEKYGWEFLFLAANIDAVENAVRIGIKRDRAVDYHADNIGTQVAYDTVAETVCAQRMGMPIEPGWASKIKKDFRSRKR